MKNTCLVIFLSILLIGCRNDEKIHKIKNEMLLLNQYLMKDAEIQYDNYKKIKGCELLKDDSVYLLGNYLIQQIEKGKDVKSKEIDFFYKESSELINNRYPIMYNKENFTDCKEIEIAKIRIIQSQYFRNVIFANMNSHFQLNIIGISPKKNKHKLGIMTNIDLSLWYYNNMQKEPIVIIGNDTLKGDGFDYIYNYKPMKIGYDTIRAKIITERWGEIKEFEPYFILKHYCPIKIQIGCLDFVKH